MENYFFDFDGTICESRHIYAASVQKAFEARGVKVPSTEDIYQAMGIPIDVSIARWAQEGHRSDLAQTLFAESMAEYALLEDDQVRLFPGIVKTLTQLKLAGKQLFVCSRRPTRKLPTIWKIWACWICSLILSGPMRWSTTSRPAMRLTCWSSGMIWT